MKTNNKDNDKQKSSNSDTPINQGNKVPNIHPTGQPKKVTEEEIKKGIIGGAPSQKSGSRGSADVQDGGSDIGSSAGSH